MVSGEVVEATSVLRLIYLLVVTVLKLLYCLRMFTITVLVTLLLYLSRYQLLVTCHQHCML
jgi:hypothetical protein